MNNTLKNELWEALIKTAVTQYNYDENCSIPAEKQLESLDLPIHYEKKLNRFIKKYSKQKKYNHVLFFIEKIAVVMLIIVSITFIGLLQFEEIRAACYNVFTEIHEKYIQMDFIPDISENDSSAKLKYLPDGFYLAQALSDDYQSYQKYENSSGDIIELFVFYQKRTIYVDNENYDISDIMINNDTGKFFESKNSNNMNYAVWNTNTEYFRLYSSLSKDMIIKLAENVY